MDFNFGTISAGTNVAFEVLEFSDLFLGLETMLAGSSFSLTSVTVNGGASTLLATGLSYTAGAGEAGNLLIATEGVAAYIGPMGGATREVVVSYSIDTDMGIEIGSITFDVEGTATPQNLDVEIDLQDEPGTAGDLTAMATAAAGDDERELNIATDDTLADIFTWLDLDGEIDFGTLPNDGDPITSTIAFASANDDATAITTANIGHATANAHGSSEATATARTDADATSFAEEDSTATATAANEASATASADIGSTATSAADNQSTAVATANDDSEAEATANNSATAITDAQADSLSSAVADGGSVATAVAWNTSDAGAQAENGSLASSTATEVSSITSTANNASIASGTADDNSVSVATSDDDSSATAFSGDNSAANANALNTGVANAAALDGSAASANASSTSDATSAAVGGSAAEATADTTASASAAAQDMSNATATAINGSTANAIADETAQATSTATGDSVALAASIECANANASAQNAGAAWAVGSLTGTPLAAADGNPVAIESGGLDMLMPVKPFMDIEDDVTVTKAQAADFAMDAITGYPSGSVNLSPAIQALVTIPPSNPTPTCGAQPDPGPQPVPETQPVPGPTGFTLLILIAALTFVAARASKRTGKGGRVQGL